MSAYVSTWQGLQGYALDTALPTALRISLLRDANVLLPEWLPIHLAH